MSFFNVSSLFKFIFLGFKLLSFFPQHGLLGKYSSNCIVNILDLGANITVHSTTKLPINTTQIDTTFFRCIDMMVLNEFFHFIYGENNIL